MSFETEIKERFKRYHLTINFYPSGGMIEIEGCSECGTNDSFFKAVTWKSHKNETLETAMTKLEEILNHANSV